MAYTTLLLLYLLLFTWQALVATVSFPYALWVVPSATKKAFNSRTLGLKMVLKWYVFFWVQLFAEMVALPLTPFVTLFANHETGRLPKGFHWMETHDALLPGYPAVQGFTKPQPTTWLGYWWQSMFWLYRNRVYRFTAENLGIWCPIDVRRYHYGPLMLTDKLPAIYGKFVEVTPNCFECYNTFPFMGRNWGWRIGYKLARLTNKEGYAQHMGRIRSGSKIPNLNQ